MQMCAPAIALFIQQAAMANIPNTQHREQIADLILVDPQDGTHLEVCSNLVSVDGSMVFEVGSFESQRRYRITISISEV